jgi:hypothetical protein
MKTLKLFFFLLLSLTFSCAQNLREGNSEDDILPVFKEDELRPTDSLLFVSFSLNYDNSTNEQILKLDSSSIAEGNQTRTFYDDGDITLLNTRSLSITLLNNSWVCSIELYDEQGDEIGGPFEIEQFYRFSSQEVSSSYELAIYCDLKADEEDEGLPVEGPIGPGEQQGEVP